MESTRHSGGRSGKDEVIWIELIGIFVGCKLECGKEFRPFETEKFRSCTKPMFGISYHTPSKSVFPLRQFPTEGKRRGEQRGQTADPFCQIYSFLAAFHRNQLAPKVSIDAVIFESQIVIIMFILTFHFIF